MRHLTFSTTPQESYPLCFLVGDIRRDEIEKAYLAPFEVDTDQVLVLTVHQSREKKKTPIKEMRGWIEEELMAVLNANGVEYILCSDGEYFKELTGVAKVDSNLGYVLNTRYGPQKVIYVPNYKQIFYDPDKVKAKIAQGMAALANHASDSYQVPGHEVIKFEEYPHTLEQIEEWLIKLLDMQVPLSFDIEGFGLKHNTSGVGTIAIAWSKHEGIAFSVDYVTEEWIDDKGTKHYGKQVRNEVLRLMLKAFFEQFMQRAVYHNISFDAYILIYQLFMEHQLDTKGLLYGMSVMLRKWDCSMLVSFLATNSCAGNELSLKKQAQEFAGNYAMTDDDIKDITLIPLPKLLRYNLIDAMSNWYVMEKNYPIMVADQQEDFYDRIFRPALLEVVQMQLTGLPVNMRKVKAVRYLLERDEKKARRKLMNSPIAHQFTQQLKQAWLDKKHTEWKKKTATLAEVPDSVVFNPNSNPQLQVLLYEMLALPVLDRTKNREPATGVKTLEKLINHTQDPLVLDFLQGLLDFGAVTKILGDFIPSFEAAILGPDGWYYLCGNFKLGGTLSGRLSANSPNLQNLPASSKYAKWIKWLVEAPPGWVFCGLDFASLEDRISALTTRDPNKLKVYTDGYDGHSLRAQVYYVEQMPDIDPNSVESINSIAKKYPKLRSKSKNPTFTLTYQGTWNTLVTKYNFTPELAKLVEARYHELYKVSDAWVEAKLHQASLDGYVTCAFGLRVRTPLLNQVIRGNRLTPNEAAAEGRSAGNALGQSWCMLNSKAASVFMALVRESQYRLDIRPCAQIHDAQYYLVREDSDVLAYVNKHLVEAVSWQDDPEIYHDEVKIGGELSVFYPTWKDEIGIPVGATTDEIPSVIEQALAKRNQ